MGKKPKNKTAKKQYFKELEQTLREEPETAAELVKNDLETFAKILEFADISKELDLKLLRALVEAVPKSMMYKLMIVLKEKILTDYKNSQIYFLFGILSFLNAYLGFKRVTKLFRNTEGFEIISQPDFWEPIYFSPRLANSEAKIDCIWFSIRISRQKSFTEKFVENYVALARECIFTLKQVCA